MKITMMNPRFTKMFFAVILILVLLLTSCSASGTYKGKYVKTETNGPITHTYYIFVFESCSEVNGEKTCQQYEQRVDEATYNSR